MQYLPIEHIGEKKKKKVTYIVTVQDFTPTICSAPALESLMGIKSGITALKHCFPWSGLN